MLYARLVLLTVDFQCLDTKVLVGTMTGCCHSSVTCPAETYLFVVSGVAGPDWISVSSMAASRGKSGSSTDEKKKLAKKVVTRLKADYPDAKCALKHRSAFQLLIATILSAQCTDERVNLVTKDLFRKYPKPADFAAAPLADIETGHQEHWLFS